jgi:hypothetical protein
MLILLRRFVLRLTEGTANNVGRLVDGFGETVKIHGEHLGVTRRHAEALAALASDPNLPPDAAQKLRSILKFEEVAEPEKQLRVRIDVPHS